jgi:hypothetical protein
VLFSQPSSGSAIPHAPEGQSEGWLQLPDSAQNGLDSYPSLAETPAHTHAVPLLQSSSVWH